MKTIEDFMKEKASEVSGLPFEQMKIEVLDEQTAGWVDICNRYAQYMCEQQRLLCCEQITLGNTVLKLKEQVLSTPLAIKKTF